MKRTVVVSPRREAPVLICKKCLKRSPAGAEIRREIKREMKAMRNGPRKDARLVTTSCFKICPKDAVVIANGDSLARGEYVLVSHQEDAKAALRLLQSSDRCSPTIDPHS